MVPPVRSGLPSLTVAVLSFALVVAGTDTAAAAPTAAGARQAPAVVAPDAAPAAARASAAAAAARPRAVPTYITPTFAAARTRSGSGKTDTRLTLDARGTVLWGDWSGQHVETPAIFRQGVWRIYDSVIGSDKELAPVARIRYGTAGDRPVVGDWDGDGRTDLGVVRGRTWYLSSSRVTERSPSTSRRFVFGPRGGQPVAGDWTGRGIDSVASYARGTWRLKKVPTAKARTVTRQFSGRSGSRPRDVAVAGDWQARGRDGFGIVRGARWVLLGDVLRKKQRSSVSVPRPARGAQPSPWTTAAGTAGDRCPTADWRLGLSDPGIVAPVGLAGDLRPPDVSGADGVRTALQRVERYLLGSHYTERWAPLRSQNFSDVRSQDRVEELAYRGPAMSALTVAVAVATGVHDGAGTGLHRQSAISYVQYLVGSIACQHSSVSPGGWGYGSQTAHWAGLAAQAAWLVWDDLPLPVRVYVDRMVRAEADFQTRRPAEYWKNRQGVTNEGRRGDTAAEELAWNSALLSLAYQMLPASPATRAYRAQAVQFEAASFATPRDLDSAAVVNGVALRDRLDGTNALDDGTVVNHHLVHPDYMGNIQMLWWGVDFARLSGGTVTESALTQADLVYGAFSRRNFVAGAVSDASGEESRDGRTTLRHFAPGGTIYRPDDADTNNIYFPDGSDWGVPRRAQFVSIDAHAVALGLAPEGAWPAEEALTAHVRGQLALGAGFSDGRTYHPDPERAKEQDRYGAREEYAASQVASAWLALVLQEADPELRVDRSTYSVPPVNARRAPAPPPSAKRMGP